MPLCEHDYRVLFTSAQEFVFFAVTSVRAGLRKNDPTDFDETLWRGVAWVNLNPLHFGVDSRGGSTNYFSLLINIVSVAIGVIIILPTTRGCRSALSECLV